MGSEPLPKTQTAALVRELGGIVEFHDDYPVPVPGHNEVLAKVLYSGVCLSGEYYIEAGMNATSFGVLLLLLAKDLSIK